jgi:transposase
MLNLNPSMSVHICTAPTDMRKSFNGLSSRVTELLEKDILTGDLFVFLNKNKTMVKILVWEKSGFCIYYKRLERGSFHLPIFETESVSSQCISTSELLLILEGVELHDSKRFKRFGIDG